MIFEVTLFSVAERREWDMTLLNADLVQVKVKTQNNNYYYYYIANLKSTDSV